MISIVLMGSNGRMGRAIDAAAAGSAQCRIAARVDEGVAIRLEEAGASPASAGYDRARGPGAGLADVCRPGDVVIEFSTPQGFRTAVGVCRERGLPFVSGTTALGAADERLIDDLATSVPVLRASNFSLGVLALRRALAAALASLPGDWDIEIVERHHRGKADSPSGTALTLAREAARSRGLGDEALRYGREGRPGPRTAQEIGLHSVRGGSWAGDHAVLLAGPGESLELRHVAEDRMAFAQGALAAARFVAGARPGRYGLEDLLTTTGRAG